MDTIKENMFFVVMGVVVLFALVLFIVVVQPMKSDNATLQDDVVRLKTNLDHLLREKDKVPNPKAIAAAANYGEAYEKQLKDLVTELETKQLSTKRPDLPDATIADPGSFKTDYGEAIRKLKGQIAAKGITAGQDAWHFWDWKGGIPTAVEQRVLATKEYSLIAELIQIVTSPELSVLQLDRVEVNPGEVRTAEYGTGKAVTTLREREEPYFELYPFVLELRMPFHKHELLMRQLLRSKKEIPLVVRKISMMRLEDDPRVYRQIPPLYIGIRIEGAALDYRLKQETEPFPTRKATAGFTGPTG